jgi:glycosyltransferase involved in cell wall biosynthesis
MAESLRVALLSYRADPRCGGQGVYVRNLSRELRDLGHRVTVFAGPPYPELDAGVAFEPVPSLELYLAPGPFKRRAWRGIRTRTDVREFWEMLGGRFPEPMVFGRRVRDLLRSRPGAFDVVHDNQSLGHGLLDLVDDGTPVVATIHHPIHIDRELALAETEDERFRGAIRRWYAFAEMQATVANRVSRLLTVSESSRRDIATHMGVPLDRIHVVHNAVDVDRWVPRPGAARAPGRIVTTASADVPLKGLLHLLEAVAKVSTERDVELVVVGRLSELGHTAAAIDRLGIRDLVTFTHGISDDEFVDLYATAELAVVPSLYEGFSLPAAEAMACGVPLVATTGGAVPEVVGPDREAAIVVPPADAGALAVAIVELLDDPALRARLGAAGRRRVVERFSWSRAARETVEHYRLARRRT